jgi:hypothetical protein
MREYQVTMYNNYTSPYHPESRVFAVTAPNVDDAAEKEFGSSIYIESFGSHWHVFCRETKELVAEVRPV